MTAPRLRPVGAHTGTVAVLVGAQHMGTVYPLVLRGVAARPVAYVAHRRGTYAGHWPNRAAAVRAVATAA